MRKHSPPASSVTHPVNTVVLDELAGNMYFRALLLIIYLANNKNIYVFFTDAWEEPKGQKKKKKARKDQ